jgi:hypothetical protein
VFNPSLLLWVFIPASLSLRKDPQSQVKTHFRINCRSSSISLYRFQDSRALSSAGFSAPSLERLDRIPYHLSIVNSFFSFFHFFSIFLDKGEQYNS